MGGALDITVRSEGGAVIADLNRVTFIDSAGLGALVGTARDVAKHGGSLHAVCSRPQTRKLLWMTGVDRRIPLAGARSTSSSAWPPRS
jgi:anti-sigma B factor antagonist